MNKKGRPITKHDDRISGYNREYYLENREIILNRKKKQMRKYRKRDPEHHRKLGRERKKKIRAKLFELYGDNCAICGFIDKRALTLDHINGNGAEERRKHGEHGVYRDAMNKYQPEKYRTLCMNCQFIERSKK